MFQLTEKEGEFLVMLARKATEEHLETGHILAVPKDAPHKIMQRSGVFVTINRLENDKKALRGCIGYPYPTTVLAQAVIECAISAATKDPRFPPLSVAELDHVVFEVSVLTPPELIVIKNPKNLPSEIKLGEDGLIIENAFSKGLLLPQVPVEHNWDKEEYLCQSCLKAGLPPDSWLTKTTRIHKFQAIIFEEETPRGKIKQKELGGK